MENEKRNGTTTARLMDIINQYSAQQGLGGMTPGLCSLMTEDFLDSNPDVILTNSKTNLAAYRARVESIRTDDIYDVEELY